jgi:hypothetical protein
MISVQIGPAIALTTGPGQVPDDRARRTRMPVDCPLIAVDTTGPIARDRDEIADAAQTIGQNRPCIQAHRAAEQCDGRPTANR